MASRTVVIGAGPAGLVTAYDLVRNGQEAIVLEQADKVGGISRTETYKGYRFDIGAIVFILKWERCSALAGDSRERVYSSASVVSNLLSR